ncbi:MAG: nicotinate-nucleotide--dimethylbenzimidazole phosphoribosyltransferase [Alphaproteobacteria bacterium]|jgi:nicotinate-nucleotide--dimethylbenzimidazole phosphoribosyltransferase|nr:nicotinate-nucleotide--dimethylbenzimidazole phosphoribosyltransferase [Alphaproteobacteria bacterium]MDP6565783.1 nicotinate-nucleotide--dimethylbenzimidazole phosphoribosyltransferase [Alphaproteobacteria bacterium]MDP6813894.1 nicotinate-nucleotide--dimethylbenzimidazole phosphoribosyltransferase [Alphaproteobacteria bacterium]
MSPSIQEIAARVKDLPGPDTASAERADARDADLTKPPGALGRLEAISRWLAAWQGRYPPGADDIAALVFAGNHGVTTQGVSPFPAEVTVQMVANFSAGGAAINQLCDSVGATLQVHALDLDRPTADMTEAPALTEDEFADAFGFGERAVPEACDLLCLGEMGIGNTTAAAALAHGLYGGAAADWTGRGTGVDDDGLVRKTEVVERAVARHRAETDAPLELFRRLGGRELAAIAGAVLAARLRRIPVLLDGFVCCAAAAPLQAANPAALEHCLAAHVSAEQGHRRLLETMAMTPLLDLGMRLGEASGAALAAGLVKAACATHNGMATFAEAGVSEADED